MLIEVRKLAANPDLQIRETWYNLDVVEDYTEAMKDGVIFPPIIVFFDGSTYWIADGFHRRAAADRAGFETIEADVRQGSKRDAILFAVGANANNGLRRTSADKRKAVMKLLSDKEWGQWSDREIARQCKVGHQLVGNLRPKPSLDDHPVTERSYKTKHGTVATMNTANIGTKEGKQKESQIQQVAIKQQESPVVLVPPVAPEEEEAYQEPLDEPETENVELEEVTDDYTMSCFNCRFYHVDLKHREQFYCMALQQVCQESELEMPCGGEEHKEEVAGYCNCCGQAVE